MIDFDNVTHVLQRSYMTELKSVRAHLVYLVVHKGLDQSLLQPTNDSQQQCDIFLSQLHLLKLHYCYRLTDL